MNNKITLYELLGKIKDGQAPKRIKSEGHYYNYNEIEKDYYEGMGYDYEYLFKNTSNDRLNDEVEILDNENEDIEELDFKTAETQKEKNRIMKDKINKLVREVNKLKKTDYLKSKGE